LIYNYIIAINQSINENYTAPIQDTYSEAFPTQVKRKETLLKSWWNWEQASFGRRLRSDGSPNKVVGPTTDKARRS